jgi:hypothetical protein
VVVAVTLVSAGAAEVAGGAPVELEVVVAGLAVVEVIAAAVDVAGALEVTAAGVELLHAARTKLLTSKITRAINKPFIFPFLPKYSSSLN